MVKDLIKLSFGVLMIFVINITGHEYIEFKKQEIIDMADTNNFQYKQSIRRPEGIIRVGGIYAHTNGNVYKVLMFSNVKSKNPNYAETVTYENVNNNKVYSRPTDDWFRSMKEFVL